jgi:hypothetical protein
MGVDDTGPEFDTLGFGCDIGKRLNGFKRFEIVGIKGCSCTVRVGNLCKRIEHPLIRPESGVPQALCLLSDTNNRIAGEEEGLM